jgi:diguanylate cyclase (GGDEF)-like protein/PAS domain S-box-containing protein
MLPWFNDFFDQGLFITDEALKICSWNHWLEANSGFHANEVMGRSLRSLYPELEQRHLDALYQQALQGQTVFLSQRLHRYLLPMSATAGDRLQFMQQSVRIAPVLKKGAIVGTITLITDVTERVLQEAALQHQIAALKQTRVALLVTHERLQHVLASSPAVIFTAQMAGDYAINFVSDNVTAQLGYEPDQFTAVPRFWANRIHPDDVARVFAELPKLLDQRCCTLEYRFCHQNGTYRWIKDERRLAEGESLYEVVGAWDDITTRKETEQQLQDQAKRDRLLAAIASRIRQSLNLEEILNTTVTEVHQLLQVDRVLLCQFQADWSGVVVVETVGDRWQALMGKVITDPCFAEGWVEAYRNGGIQAAEDISQAGFNPRHIDFLEQLQVRANLVIPILQGESLWGLLVAQHCSEPRPWHPWEVSLLQQLGTQVGIAIHQSKLYKQAQTELAERKRAEDLLHHNALHDAITGLANRTLFLNRLKQALSRTKPAGDPSAVLLLDIDDFKMINESMGHLVGDQLLIEFAQRLKMRLKPGDLVARLSGNEFAFLLEGIPDEAAVLEVAKQIQAFLTLPFKLNRMEVFVTASIGIVVNTSSYDRPDHLLRDAETAMHEAKSKGQGSIILFDHHMHTRALARLRLESGLRRALGRHEFLLNYQPIVSLKLERIVGFEALIRWQHPERGLVPPSEFIPLAEETGIIMAIDQWALRTACQQMQQWQTQFPDFAPLTISVNLSAKHFSQPELVEQVKQTLQETGLAAQSLKLEITENTLMSNAEVATTTLKQLRSLGVQISMDDFGTGYSSLSYLHRFPIDTLKIDRSFVMNLEQTNENTKITQAMIMLARSLNLDVIAEGIETSVQLMLLKAMGCEFGQGYFFSKPLSSEAATIFLRQQVQTHPPTQASTIDLLHKRLEKVWKTLLGCQKPTSTNRLTKSKSFFS